MYQVRCRTQIRRPEVNAEKPISCRAATCQRAGARGAAPTTSAPGTGRRLEDASGRARVRIYGSAPCRTDLRTYRTARDEWRNAGSSHAFEPLTLSCAERTE